MDIDTILAVTKWGAETRFLGFNFNYFTILGAIGMGIFSSRFIVQWVASEKAGESVIPISFWHLSIWGSVIMGTYMMLQRDPIGFLGYLPNVFIYARNLALIRKKKRAATAAAPTQTPLEETGDKAEPYVR